MNGNLLGKPRSLLDADAGASSAMLDYRQSIEHDLLVKIHSTLDPLLGPEKYRAGVTLECDFTSGDQSEETFDPDHSVMLTSQKTEESNGTTSSGGVPGTASNLPRPVPPSPGGRGAVSRKTENVTYQTSRVVKHVKLPQGPSSAFPWRFWWIRVFTGRGLALPPSVFWIRLGRYAESRQGSDLRRDRFPAEPRRPGPRRNVALRCHAGLPAPEPFARPVPAGPETVHWMGGVDSSLALAVAAVAHRGRVLLYRCPGRNRIASEGALGRKAPKVEVALAGGARLAPGTATPAQLGSPAQFEAKAMAQLARTGRFKSRPSSMLCCLSKQFRQRASPKS